MNPDTSHVNTSCMFAVFVIKWKHSICHFYVIIVTFHKIPKITVLVGSAETSTNRRAAQGEIKRPGVDGSLAWVWMEKLIFHLSHGFTGEKGNVLSFSEVLRPLCGCQTTLDTYSIDVILFFLFLCFVLFCFSPDVEVDFHPESTA